MEEGGSDAAPGREADGNYVCLALCTGRKRWLIPFGETFVFTIFYSFVYFLVSFLLEFCQKSFLLCVFFEWSIFRLNLVVAAYSFGGVHSFLPG
mgnify:CR=1 FL=1